ncbi:4971_t:CDS:2 [Diversispora eburnea]|uniref:4971_t:CDS:1 n=1 Tax=Diversispora eburnea TaxID=1213867 RepID=A0A9N8V959_9GLOM|nr:4971_t:CDS:2 [Diversispora eburnea]
MIDEEETTRESIGSYEQSGDISSILKNSSFKMSGRQGGKLKPLKKEKKKSNDLDEI